MIQLNFWAGRSAKNRTLRSRWDSSRGYLDSCSPHSASRSSDGRRYLYTRYNYGELRPLGVLFGSARSTKGEIHFIVPQNVYSKCHIKILTYFKSRLKFVLLTR